jgi:hypothetical protein
LAALASVDSLMPLHSAVAGARLRSCIAADSACWGSLSQGDLSASFSPYLCECIWKSMLIGYVFVFVSDSVLFYIEIVLSCSAHI